MSNILEIISKKPLRDRRSMALFYLVNFIPNHTNRKTNLYVNNHRNYFSRIMATGPCDQFYLGRVYSYPTGNCHHHASDQIDSRAPGSLITARVKNRKANQ